MTRKILLARLGGALAFLLLLTFILFLLFNFGLFSSRSAAVPLSTRTAPQQPTTITTPGWGDAGPSFTKWGLLSPGRPPVSGDLPADMLLDGQFRLEPFWHQKGGERAWVSFDLGKGAERILVVWNSGANTNYNELKYGGMRGYRLLVSGDSTDGRDGTWEETVNIQDNILRTREHRIEFKGKRWVRLVIDTLPSETRDVALDEIQFYDISKGGKDGWFFLGDSITADCLDRAPDHQPDFSRLGGGHGPGAAPLIDGGVNGINLEQLIHPSATSISPKGADFLDLIIQANPDLYYWPTLLGTNDVTSDPAGVHLDRYKENLTQLIMRLEKTGHLPVFATIPYSKDPNRKAIPLYNSSIKEIIKEHNLPPGPDLYTWFAAHQDELSSDGVHPNERGCLSLNRLWFEQALTY